MTHIQGDARSARSLMERSQGLARELGNARVALGTEIKRLWSVDAGSGSSSQGRLTPHDFGFETVETTAEGNDLWLSHVAKAVLS